MGEHFSFYLTPANQVRIPHSEIDKLACQAESAGILTFAVKILVDSGRDSPCDDLVFVLFGGVTVGLEPISQLR